METNLFVKRLEPGERYTVGKLFLQVENLALKYLSFTLEDKDRGLASQMALEDIVATKVYGQTAIPYGRYSVVMKFSPKYNMVIPHLLNVPGYDLIEMHWGNTDLDTDGCILTARTHPVNTDFIGDSKRCFMEDILPVITGACAEGEVFITIQKAIA